MSIVALKRKTQAKYNNMSVGRNGFSLNGALRSQGYVGQTSLSRSLPKTMMKGNVACGYGGCCGTYNVVPIVQSAVNSLNNPNVIKSSVINTMGMLENKMQCTTTCNNSFLTVKPDNNQNINDQSSYITQVSTQAANCDVIKDVSENMCNPACNKYGMQYNPYYRKNITNITTPNNVTTINGEYNTNYVPITSSEYISQLKSQCTNYDKPYIQTPYYRTPYI